MNVYVNCGLEELLQLHMTWWIDTCSEWLGLGLGSPFQWHHNTRNPPTLTSFCRGYSSPGWDPLTPLDKLWSANLMSGSPQLFDSLFDQTTTSKFW